MFSDELKNISWQETTERIASMTDADVRRALGKSRCDVNDFMALLSPAAEPYLEQMARLSRKYTEERFGRTMSMFIPLYITNSCSNSCVYCGFHRENPMARTILTPEQIEDEYRAIKQLAPFENILLVTGENPAKAGVPYLAKAIDIAKRYFSNIKIEVMPLKMEEYRERINDVYAYCEQEDGVCSMYPDVAVLDSKMIVSGFIQADQLRMPGCILTSSYLLRQFTCLCIGLSKKTVDER